VGQVNYFFWRCFVMSILHDGVEGSAPPFVYWVPMTVHDVAGAAHGAAHTSHARCALYAPSHACMHAPYTLALCSFFCHLVYVLQSLL
jgi:hypothetical protein